MERVNGDEVGREIARQVKAFLANEDATKLEFEIRTSHLIAMGVYGRLQAQRDLEGLLRDGCLAKVEWFVNNDLSGHKLRLWKPKLNERPTSETTIREVPSVPAKGLTSGPE